jgi:hypothetical protein
VLSAAHARVAKAAGRACFWLALVGCLLLGADCCACVPTPLCCASRVRAAAALKRVHLLFMALHPPLLPLATSDDDNGHNGDGTPSCQLPPLADAGGPLRSCRFIQARCAKVRRLILYTLGLALSSPTGAARLN